MSEIVQPDFAGPISPLGQFKRDVDRAAREAAGELPYSPDDPERPFTDEYEAPLNVASEEETTKVDIDIFDGGTVDDSPSSGARELYVMPTPSNLDKIRHERRKVNIAGARAILHALSPIEPGANLNVLVSNDKIKDVGQLAIGGDSLDDAILRHPSNSGKV